ncbi:MAG: HRDC domain-containing protein, partial [Pseudomonadota bacterium]|nr:HRDC domain-containing protein [Pseudomonadota bacterium]
STPPAPADLPSDAAARFEALRAWRAEAARTQNVPAYVIFHDRTLREIALARPSDVDGLAGVPGVGAAKLERYGEALLALLIQ